MSKSTAGTVARKPVRPNKPCKGYPLLFHASGRIARKIKQRLHYFGRWGNVKNGTVVAVKNIEDAARASPLAIQQ